MIRRMPLRETSIYKVNSISSSSRHHHRPRSHFPCNRTSFPKVTMHSIILLTTSLTAALANPLSSNNQRLVKRATCQANGAVVTPSPTGAGPVPTPSDPTNWKAYSGFSSAATNAALPAGYKRSFANLKASINDDDYLTYWPLDAYSTAECAKYCNAEVKCKGFNIYFERDPINSCPNPPPTTFIKYVCIDREGFFWMSC